MHALPIVLVIVEAICVVLHIYLLAHGEGEHLEPGHGGPDISIQRTVDGRDRLFVPDITIHTQNTGAADHLVTRDSAQTDGSVDALVETPPRDDSLSGET